MDTVHIGGQTDVGPPMTAAALEGEHEFDTEVHWHARFQVRAAVELDIGDVSVEQSVCKVSRDLLATVQGADVPCEDEDVAQPTVREEEVHQRSHVCVVQRRGARGKPVRGDEKRIESHVGRWGDNALCFPL
ncbi:hypothetical protein GSI_03436 [Ganoderma sinense ZZ0214-1]|uniref:Uncharacterized protein n=1 Tax=Ganoderma sinense ZZ0214-1 TaxID=1077348 RepID=A0A2G8SLJ7_9APHY|nr:hypothetical protein GSI_03436 [Ganoderma sinense ZZ0214-1]